MSLLHSVFLRLVFHVESFYVESVDVGPHHLFILVSKPPGSSLAQNFVELDIGSPSNPWLTASEPASGFYAACYLILDYKVDFISFQKHESK